MDPRPESGEKKPWYKNVWVIATLSSMATITMLRPCTRYVPEPPAATGTLPAWSLATADGKPFGSVDLAGSVYVLGLYAEHGGEASDAVLRALGQLQDRYTKAQSPVKVVAARVGDGPLADLVRAATAMRAERPRWTFVGGGDAAAIGKSFDALHGEVHPAPWEHGVAIVDGDGACRGFYGTSDDGIDETFHRSLRVVDELNQKKRQSK